MDYHKALTKEIMRIKEKVNGILEDEITADEDSDPNSGLTALNEETHIKDGVQKVLITIEYTMSPPPIQ